MKLPSRVFSFLWYFIRQQKLQFLIVLATSFVWALNDTFFPFFLRLIVDRLENYHCDPTEIFYALYGILLFLVLSWLVAEVVYRSQGVLLIYTFPRFRANIRQTVFKYVKAHSHQYFSDHFAGN